MTSSRRASLRKLVAGKADLTEKKMVFVGWLNRELPRGQQAVLVGGSVVQFYSGGAYESIDIDLVVSRRDEINSILKDAGLREDVPGFEDLDLGLVIDLSTKGLRPSETVKIVRFEGFDVPVVSLEDAIVDRLLGAKSWRSDLDWEQALLLYRVNRERIDENALASKAKANDVSDAVERLRAA